MEQRHNGDGLLRIAHAIQLLYPWPCQVILQAVVHIHAVLHQSPLMGAVIPAAGGSTEKIAAVQILQQSVRTLPVDVLLVNLDEFFLC